MSTAKDDKSETKPEKKAPRDPLPWSVKELQDLYGDGKAQKAMKVSASQIALRLGRIYVGREEQKQNKNYAEAKRAFLNAAREATDAAIQDCAKACLLFIDLEETWNSHVEHMSDAESKAISESQNKKRLEMLEYFKRAAEHGVIDAWYYLALDNFGSLGGSKQAIAYLEEGAKHGDLLAQFRLGIIYASSLHDIAKAERSFKLAADQGFAMACFDLGIIYEDKALESIPMDEYTANAAINFRNAILLQKPLSYQPLYYCKEEAKKELYGLRGEKLSAENKIALEYSIAIVEDNVAVLRELYHSYPQQILELYSKDIKNPPPEISAYVAKIVSGVIEHEKKTEAALNEIFKAFAEAKNAATSVYAIDSDGVYVVGSAESKRWQGSTLGEEERIKQSKTILENASSEIERLVKMLDELEAKDATGMVANHKMRFSLLAKKIKKIAEGDQTEGTLLEALETDKEKKVANAMAGGTNLEMAEIKAMRRT